MLPAGDDINRIQSLCDRGIRMLSDARLAVCSDTGVAFAFFDEDGEAYSYVGKICNFVEHSVLKLWSTRKKTKDRKASDQIQYPYSYAISHTSDRTEKNPKKMEQERLLHSKTWAEAYKVQQMGRAHFTEKKYIEVIDLFDKSINDILMHIQLVPLT